MHIIPFEIINIENEGYHIVLDIEILDSKYKIVLDTGASKTVLDKHTLLNIGLKEEDFTSTDILSTGLGTNEMKSEMLDLKSISLGTWSIKNITVAVLDLSAINYAYNHMNLEPVIGVLGGDILTQYGAIINYKKKTLQLNTRRAKKQS